MATTSDLENHGFTEFGVVGIYALCQDDVVNYIGQTSYVLRRVNEHKHNGRVPFNRVWFLPCTRQELDLLEWEHITRFDPPYNHKRPGRPTKINLDISDAVLKELGFTRSERRF